MPFPATDRLTLDEETLRRFLEGPDGPIVADLMRRGQNVEAQAKINASGAQVAGASNRQNRGPNVDTGRLRSSISHAPGRDEQGVYVVVGSNVFYGKHLELGWTTSRGNFVKYPFLVPALPAAAA